MRKYPLDGNDSSAIVSFAATYSEFQDKYIYIYTDEIIKIVWNWRIFDNEKIVVIRVIKINENSPRLKCETSNAKIGYTRGFSKCALTIVQCLNRSFLFSLSMCAIFVQFHKRKKKKLICINLQIIFSCVYTYMTIFETFICHFYLCLARRNTNNALTCAIILKHLSYVLESNIKKKKGLLHKLSTIM